MTIKGPIMGEIDLSTHICSDSKGELMKPDGPSKQQAQIFMTLQLCFFVQFVSLRKRQHARRAAGLCVLVLFVNSLSRQLRPGTWSSFLLLLTAPVAGCTASRMELNRVFSPFFLSPHPQQTLVVMWHFNDKINQSDLPSRPGHNGVCSSQ